MNPTKNDIPAEKRTAIARMLNNRLAELIDLQLQAKQAHWNVKGATFIAFHELFDSVAEQATAFADLVAERIVALGGIAEGTLAAVAQRSKLTAYPLSITAAPAHVDALSSSIATVGKAVRSGIDQATELGDADSADILTEISRELDKKLWFVEAHLQND